MFDITDLSVPIVAAPMAGGPSTPALATAVGDAGGLGFLAAGYAAPATVAEQIRQVRSATTAPFGVNVFVPGAPADPAAVAAYRAELEPEAARYDADLPEPDPGDDDHWDDKLALLVDDPVPVVSFTFGVPDRDVVQRLRAAGSAVLVTVTSPGEAAAAVSAGADVLCVQGPEAGGHRGTFDPEADPDPTPLPALLAAVTAMSPIPVVAAGGIMTGDDVAAAMRAGTVAVQLGTAFLRTPESGARRAHKDALADARFDTTTLTRAFSGRWARGLRNGFVDAHPDAPAGYPMVDQMTKPLRAAAAALGDPERMSLWAGTGYRAATEEPAATVTTRLWERARNSR
ncbi:nitroalkane oxidase [Haloactinopolyspora alba]|uniref:Probable nitronate monooxygenase n=1 Tax=Haloactinopolyspora alba TaxID=648780 RepID=A0A2P8E520_9ACTN|nr:nitronate monooxygenase [Haloactinopolyspora alba]PSL04568.1 nitroalkane oxidase [Haloactinopolyspora alba]